MKKETIFWDVDTQYDFMRPEGRLYVPGAEGIIDKVSEVRRFALENGFSIIGSTDWHKEGNAEISDKPDFKGTFPAHCLADTPGSDRVGYLGKLPIDIVPNERMEECDLRKLAEKNQFHIVIRKEEFDVFSNPNTTRLVEMLKPKAAVVFGVPLDVCVRQTVEGLNRIGGTKLSVVKDAVKGLGTKGEEKIAEDFRKKGIEVVTLGALQRGLLHVGKAKLGSKL